ncbi:D-aminoacyl-tRNA deacylase [Aliidiomarina haloalkalitolerans]|uniref:D-aminoacyl-tRNA deacylase n=1 Tax=Aliidiomarina haloalkalitolerans TaxID=859059 RepID=A0A432VRG9_9GAMM|nr:D-aminoacyl-tRNA deacylase [Aliidiomarina haloalkalitolerans]RUO18881.1 D-tyrosyl-tRNA(Tyr) deacylase [Aliidiomarina haloalkalitolerans]
MIGLIQRVTSARVDVAGKTIGAIEQGILVLLGVERNDTEDKAKQLAKRIASYRVFADAYDKMNLDVRDIQGSVLVVSQFTLAADTRKGRRPSFSSAAVPALANELYQVFCQALANEGVPVATGEFAADMQVHLVNDGPVTFTLQV